jgi:hypothetical protein
MSVTEFFLRQYLYFISNFVELAKHLSTHIHQETPAIPNIP